MTWSKRHCPKKEEGFISYHQPLIDVQWYLIKGNILKRPPRYERMVAWHIKESVPDVEILKVGQ
jgi:hypothetical protein